MMGIDIVGECALFIYQPLFIAFSTSVSGSLLFRLLPTRERLRLYLHRFTRPRADVDGD